MDFDLTSFVLFVRTVIGLIFTPYKTMRRISMADKLPELGWIFILTLVYFLITNTVRFWLGGLMGACGLYIISILLLSIFPAIGTYKERLKKLVYTWTYTLIPTLIWFYSTLLFYFIVPPPRTTSFLGKSFSIFYIAFSGSLLVWKLILVYLSVRFSLRVHLYRVIYYLLLYFALSIPLWIFLYENGISRIPFV